MKKFYDFKNLGQNGFLIVIVIQVISIITQWLGGSVIGLRALKFEMTGVLMTICWNLM